MKLITILLFVGTLFPLFVPKLVVAAFDGSPLAVGLLVGGIGLPLLTLLAHKPRRGAGNGRPIGNEGAARPSAPLPERSAR